MDEILTFPSCKVWHEFVGQHRYLKVENNINKNGKNIIEPKEQILFIVLALTNLCTAQYGKFVVSCKKKRYNANTSFRTN